MANAKEQDIANDPEAQLQPQNQHVDEHTNLIDKSPQENQQEDPEESPVLDKNDSLNKSMKQLESAHAFN